MSDAEMPLRVGTYRAILKRLNAVPERRRNLRYSTKGDVNP